MLSGPFVFTNTLDWFHWQQWNVKSANATTNMSMVSHTEHKTLACQWWRKSIKTPIKRIQVFLPQISDAHTVYTHKWTIASRIYCCYNNLLSFSNIKGKWFIRLKLLSLMCRDHLKSIHWSCLATRQQSYYSQFLIFVQYEITSSMF